MDILLKQLLRWKTNPTWTHKSMMVNVCIVLTFNSIFIIPKKTKKKTNINKYWLLILPTLEVDRVGGEGTGPALTQTHKHYYTVTTASSICTLIMATKGMTLFMYFFSSGRAPNSLAITLLSGRTPLLLWIDNEKEKTGAETEVYWVTNRKDIIHKLSFETQLWKYRWMGVSILVHHYAMTPVFLHVTYVKTFICCVWMLGCVCVSHLVVLAEQG